MIKVELFAINLGFCFLFAVNFVIIILLGLML